MPAGEAASSARTSSWLSQFRRAKPLHPGHGPGRWRARRPRAFRRAGKSPASWRPANGHAAKAARMNAFRHGPHFPIEVAGPDRRYTLERLVMERPVSMNTTGGLATRR